MEINDILTLAKAGFTAEQIAVFSGSVQTPTQAQAQAQAYTAMPYVQTPTATPYAYVPTAIPYTPTPAPATASAVVQQTPNVDATLEAMMQRTMARFAQQPPQRSTDDILAEIINPPATDKGGNR